MSQHNNIKNQNSLSQPTRSPSSLFLSLTICQTKNPTLPFSPTLSSSFTSLSAHLFIHLHHIFSLLYPFSSFHRFQIGRPTFLHVTIVFFTTLSPVIFFHCLLSLLICNFNEPLDFRVFESLSCLTLQSLARTRSGINYVRFFSYSFNNNNNNNNNNN
jgi:hypothetical protein